MKHTLLTFILFASIPFLTSCDKDTEPESVKLDLQSYSWVSRTADDEPMIGDNFDYIIYDRYVTTLLFVSDYECVVRNYTRRFDSDEGTKTYTDAETIKYHVNGNKIILESSAFSENELTYSERGLYSKNYFYERTEISQYDREWLAENYKPITPDSGNSSTEDNQKANWLQRVWIHKAGRYILHLDDGTATEYELSNPGSKTWLSMSTCSYTFSLANMTINLFGKNYDIKELSTQSLCISSSDKKLEYTSGTTADLPTARDMTAFLVGGWTWYRMDGLNKWDGSTISFGKQNDVYLLVESNISYGASGPIYLQANGTFYTSGDDLICDYNEVYWQGGTETKYSNIFPGWTYGQSRRVIYHINYVSPDNTYILMTDETGTEYKYSGINYAD